MALKSQKLSEDLENTLDILASRNENLPYYRRLDERVGDSLYRDHLNRV
jgi:hypothetical protein